METGQIRILVADDEYYICEGLKEALAKDGYRVDVAHDGLEAESCLKLSLIHI